jgi:hypothetical protein
MRRRRIVTGAAVVVLCACATARAESRLAALLARAAPTADPSVLTLAARAAECAGLEGSGDEVDRLAVIDYSRPSDVPRLWVFDLDRGRLLFEELVAHGRGTGERLAERFSNAEGSHMSSLGLFRTTDPYDGGNGYSLRLEGLEPGFNDRALDRAIVMHGAPYVSDEFARAQGRLGRSWGCPALREGIAREVIDTVKGTGLVFAYYPDPAWLVASKYLGDCGGAPDLAAGL